MSAPVIDAEPGAAGLPPPLLISVADASQFVYLLRQDSAQATAIQLVAARNGEGTSTLARDVALVAAGSIGLSVLLLAGEPQRAADWPRSLYGLPAGLQPLAGPAGLEMWRLPGAAFTVAAPAAGPVVQPSVWGQIMRELRTRCELLIVDAPAMQRAFTGMVLAPLVDASLLVVAADSTRASATRSLRDRLAEAGGHTAGVLLNKRKFYVPRAAYERL